MKNNIFYVFLALVAIIVVTVIIHGAFTTIKTSNKNIDKLLIVYAKHIGEYSSSSKVMNGIYFKLLNEENITTFKGIGIYFDNPQTTDKKSLRSIVGCVLEKNDEKKVEYLKTKGFSIAELPQNTSTVAIFKYLSPLSIFLGVIKVYPVLNKYSMTNSINNPITEIYDIKEKNIIYSLNDGIDTTILMSLLK